MLSRCSFFSKLALVVSCIVALSLPVWGQTFYGAIAGEVAIFGARFLTNISFLWYNVIGCVAVVGTGLLLGRTRASEPRQ